jgi:7-keto-8-aminopelargonate synthetase-like enzyme
MLDESHAVGVFGDNGRGVAEHFGLLDEIDIIMGTFSKAFASIGGFVAGEKKILDTLKHTARSHIFSASLPPSAVAAVLAAISIVDEEPGRRARLLKNARYLSDGLRNLGYQVRSSGGPIISILCGNELIALAAFQRLFEEGVFVNPVTWPAVPKDEEMLRASVMTTHNEGILDNALDAFERVRTSNWPRGARYGGKNIISFN